MARYPAKAASPKASAPFSTEVMAVLGSGYFDWSKAPRLGNPGFCTALRTIPHAVKCAKMEVPEQCRQSSIELCLACGGPPRVRA